MRKLLLFLLLLPSVARAEVGYDFLGIKSRYWNCQAMLDALNTRPGKFPAGAFVDDTFGTDDTCLHRLFASGKISEFRGHLAWTNHQPISVTKLIPRAQKFSALCAAYPGVDCYASMVCEHNLSAAQSAALNAAIRPYLGVVKGITDSGMRAADPAATREKHGTSVAPWSSNDGTAAEDIDIEGWKNANRGNRALIWMRSFNCRLQNGSLPPAQRRDCPSRDQFNWAVRVSYPQPPWPPGRRLDNGQIYKNWAEYYGGLDQRGNKPMFILRADQPRMDLFAMNGQKIGSARLYGRYTQPGLYRYYTGCWQEGRATVCGSGQSSFQLGQAAEIAAGSEYFYFPTNRGSFVVNAYRRSPAR